MDGANERAKRKILSLFEKKEILISVHSATGGSTSTPPIEELADSRIWCDYLLLGGPRKLIEEDLPIPIENFYFPILSAERQKRTFLTLLTLLAESGARISAPILEKRRKFPRNIFHVLGWSLENNREQSIYKLLLWSKIAQDKGIPLSVFKQQGPLEIPERSWIVSDPWNQIDLIRALNEKHPKYSNELEWYQVTIVQKILSEVSPEKRFGIAS